MVRADAFNSVHLAPLNFSSNADKLYSEQACCLIARFIWVNLYRNRTNLLFIVSGLGGLVLRASYGISQAKESTIYKHVYGLVISQHTVGIIVAL